MFAGLSQYMPFGAAPSAAEIEEQEAQVRAQLQSRADASKQFADQQLDMQRNMLNAEHERSTQVVTTQMTVARDQKLMQLDQQFSQQKMALNQQQAQTLAQIEQQALALSARAQQARSQAEMQSKFSGYTVPMPALDEAQVAEGRNRQVAAVNERAEATLSAMSAQYEAQRQMVELQAKRDLDLALAQLDMKQQQGTMALKQRQQNQDMQLNQQTLVATNQLRERTLGLISQAEQARLQREAAEKVMATRGALGGYPGMGGYPVYGQSALMGPR